MVSQRIKYAMAHLSRKQHTRLLARPNWRRLRRTDANIVADPSTIPRAALRSKASKRIKIMARPKHVTKRYDLFIFEQHFFQYRKPPPRDHDWDKHREIIAQLAVPKVVHRPIPFVTKKKWRPVNMRRLENLSQPVSREIPMDRDPFSVAPSALKYTMTDRMMQLVNPTGDIEVVPPRIPGAVSRAALKATASPRTVDLARPVVRPAGMETDLREDAFTVSPAALKARCSRRLKKLARPKNYKPRRH